MAWLDQDGQPVIRAFFDKRIADRGVDEMIGLCRGMIADGQVDQSEAEYILRWLEANQEAACRWPCNILAARAAKYLEDGHLDSEEAKDLLETMAQITGDNLQTQTNTNFSIQADLVPTSIVFEGSTFCFTGKFAFGPRKECQRETERLGGTIKNNLTKEVNYLVLGCIGSEAWAHSSFGRKIEHAQNLRMKGTDIAVVPEDIWAECLVK